MSFAGSKSFTTSHKRLGSVPESASVARSTFSKSVGENAASSFWDRLFVNAAAELASVADGSAQLSRLCELLKSISYGDFASKLNGAHLFEGSNAVFGLRSLATSYTGCPA